MKPTQGTRIISSPSLTGVFDVVDVLPLAERVAVLAPARPRPLADVHQVPFGWRDRVIKVQTTRALQGQDWSVFVFVPKDISLMVFSGSWVQKGLQVVSNWVLNPQSQ